MQLVLSIFSGVGLLDKAFKEAGFCVVSAGDLITGQDIRDFTGVKNKFNGIIGGSPCQDFSGLKRVKTDYSEQMIFEFLRVVNECEPDWYLLENVKGVPNVTDILGLFDNRFYNPIFQTFEKYSHQRIDINQGWYDDTSRLRHIQFGSKDNHYLDIPRGKMRNIKSSCALASDDRSFKELCSIQGLSDSYDLPDFNVKGKKKAVGNGVPLSIGRVLAKAVLDVTVPGNKSATERVDNSVTLQHNFSVNNRVEKTVTQQDKKRCACGCGRVLIGRKKSYDSTCRKRLQRKNNNCDLAAQQLND